MLYWVVWNNLFELYNIHKHLRKYLGRAYENKFMICLQVVFNLFSYAAPDGTLLSVLAYV